MVQWMGIIIHGNVKQVLIIIRRKHWKLIQKKIVAAVWGAMVNYTWRSQNWNLFKGQTVHIERAITQSKEELIDRLSLPYIQKKLDRSRGFKQRIYM